MAQVTDLGSQPWSECFLESFVEEEAASELDSIWARGGTFSDTELERYSQGDGQTCLLLRAQRSWADTLLL